MLRLISFRDGVFWIIKPSFSDLEEDLLLQFLELLSILSEAAEVRKEEERSEE